MGAGETGICGQDRSGNDQADNAAIKLSSFGREAMAILGSLASRKGLAASSEMQ